MWRSSRMSTLAHYTTIYRSAYVIIFFNDTATTEIYTLSLHDALPISPGPRRRRRRGPGRWCRTRSPGRRSRDRKSTRLNSSHANISYAVFCLKKKNSRSEEHTSELQSRHYLQCGLLLVQLS